MNPTENTPAAGFQTLCIHGGHRPDAHRAHLTPIYASSTYTFEHVDHSVALFEGREEGYIYGRFGNPTIREAEEKIALLEGYGLTDAAGELLRPAALLHASGMAAIQTLLFGLLSAGDAVLTQESLYGGTQETFDRILPQLNISYFTANLNDAEAVAEVLKAHPEIKLVYAETPDNPTIRLIDLESLGEVCNAHNIPLAVDNTFCTPYLQQPFRWGATYVIHSTTKFLNGHGTAVGGALVARTAEYLKGRMLKTHRLFGGNANAFDAFLLTAGMRTLALRMDRHCANAVEVAQFLQGHSKVKAVHFPHFEAHPEHGISRRQMRRPGAMLSFELAGGHEAAVQLLNNVQLCTFAVSLGTPDTLLSHPASSTHAGVSEEAKAKAGVTPGLIRMSVGLEDTADIIADLEKAMG